MYNKIASIILNLAKIQGSGTVYISQPDIEREKIAGKLFLLAEIRGKKSEGEKILDFLIAELEENYYQDEKILLIGKIEGLKPENIFEASLAKINKNLNEFLKDHKIRLDPEITNITLGFVCGHKLHFSSFGRNRSLLIYRRQDGYEIINVEADAKTSETKDEKKKEKFSKSNNLFSSIVSGEIPLGSYFVFASESLPEYLSSRDLVSIITKLPPIVAAEQIKNLLAKINNYVPFLGIIIKNTTDSLDQERKETVRTELSAHNSISSLNYTEEKTESMLSPAGLINLNRAGRIFKTWLRFRRTGRQNISKKELVERKKNYPSLSLRDKKNKIKLLNLPNASSFLRPQKISLKKGSYHFFITLKQFISFVPRLFSLTFWQGFFKDVVFWFKSLNKRNLVLGLGFIVIIIVFSVSLINASIKKSNQEEKEAFNLMVSEIEEKESLIDSHLLYDNKDGASRVLIDIKDLVAVLPQKKDYQIKTYNELSQRLSLWEDKILGIVRIDELEEVASFPNLNLSGLILAGEMLYGNSDSSLYSLNLESKLAEEIKIKTPGLSDGRYYGEKKAIYYRDEDKILSLDINSRETSVNNLANYDIAEDYSGFDLFNQKLYLLSRANSQLYIYSSNFSSRSDWLKETADLSQVVDLYIDGSIYFLYKDGQINKFYLGRQEKYDNSPLNPPTSQAKKILGDDEHLYVLDNNDRLIVINKEDGRHEKQYIFTNLDVSDFAISENRENAYILSQAKIYLLPFKINNN
jgi:hypothetical protein